METKFEKYDDDGRQLTWDASSLSSFMRCAQLYKFKKEWRYKSFNPATTWGSAVHDGLNVLDDAEVQGKKKMDVLDEAVRAVMQDPHGLRESEDNARNLFTAARAVVWYAEQFNDDQYMETAALPDGSPAVEVRFEYELPGLDRRFSGRLDKLARIDDRLYIVERKTTKTTLGPWYFKNHYPGVQMYTYMWALRKFLDLDVGGICFEAIQAAVGFNRVHRALFNINKNQLDEFERNVVYYINQAKNCEETGVWPQNFSACSAMGGCEFRDICTKPEYRRQMWLELDFDKRKRGPSGTPAKQV